MGYKDLVIKMLESGSYINNTSFKNDEIVQNLAKHSKNLDNLIYDGDNALIKRNISLLVENMKQEFVLV